MGRDSGDLVAGRRRNYHARDYRGSAGATGRGFLRRHFGWVNSHGFAATAFQRQRRWLRPQVGLRGWRQLPDLGRGHRLRFLERLDFSYVAST
jgi:hypothetical protein